MKRFIFILLPFVFSIPAISQTCTSYYSYTVNFETVEFYNGSTLSDAHYWWNFGDGTGSNFKHPIHTFPENGIYLVTLFVLDTITNCSSHYEQWLTVSKYSTTPCSPFLSDSVVTIGNHTYIYPIHTFSSYCNGYHILIDGIGIANFPGNSALVINPVYSSARFLIRSKYSNYNIDPNNRYRKAYTTIMYNSPSNANYGDCSANFEFIVTDKDSLNQHIFCTAMNKSAISYDWIISGFGTPIHYYTDTISQKYTNYDHLPIIGLTIEGPNGCRDTLFQQIHINPEGVQTIVGLDIPTLPKFNVQIFPNPFSSNTTIKFENPNNETYSLTITSITGQIVKIIQDINANQIELDRENMASGIYLYQLYNTKHHISTGKLIVK